MKLKQIVWEISTKELIDISSKGENMVIDVICGMEIDEKEAKWKSEYKGKTFYFCGPLCKMEFDDNPEKYAQSN